MRGSSGFEEKERNQARVFAELDAKGVPARSQLPVVPQIPDRKSDQDREQKEKPTAKTNYPYYFKPDVFVPPPNQNKQKEAETLTRLYGGEVVTKSRDDAKQDEKSVDPFYSQLDKLYAGFVQCVIDYKQDFFKDPANEKIKQKQDFKQAEAEEKEALKKTEIEKLLRDEIVELQVVTDIVKRLVQEYRGYPNLEELHNVKFFLEKIYLYLCNPDIEFANKQNIYEAFKSGVRVCAPGAYDNLKDLARQIGGETLAGSLYLLRLGILQIHADKHIKRCEAKLSAEEKKAYQSYHKHVPVVFGKDLRDLKLGMDTSYNDPHLHGAKVSALDRENFLGEFWQKHTPEKVFDLIANKATFAITAAIKNCSLQPELVKRIIDNGKKTKYLKKIFAQALDKFEISAARKSTILIYLQNTAPEDFETNFKNALRGILPEDSKLHAGLRDKRNLNALCSALKDCNLTDQDFENLKQGKLPEAEAEEKAAVNNKKLENLAKCGIGAPLLTALQDSEKFVELKAAGLTDEQLESIEKGESLKQLATESVLQAFAKNNVDRQWLVNRKNQDKLEWELWWSPLDNDVLRINFNRFGEMIQGFFTQMEFETVDKYKLFDANLQFRLNYIEPFLLQLIQKEGKLFEDEAWVKIKLKGGSA